MEKKANIFVICAPEISSILHDEIKALGFTNSTKQRLGVQLNGTFADTMYLNLHFLIFKNDIFWSCVDPVAGIGPRWEFVM